MSKPIRKAAVPALAAALLTACAGFAVFFVTLPSPEPFRHQNPSTTALMDARAAEAKAHHRPVKRNWKWVPLSRISPWLQKAVVNSEDARFFEHDGIDMVETEAAISKAAEHHKLGRGASTISQQLAKNLWLGEERSLSRKVREAALARRLETLGKERILELYLNVAEWGDGIYGAEAASRYWFHKSAASLLPEEAALLTAMLPAPRQRNPKHPNDHLKRRAFTVLELYTMYGQLTPDQVAEARRYLEEMVAGPVAER
ncbi:MAG TPA: monofunctional biosynthetic peptidoglycan transglycosylase [Myxococcales bacterium]|nr:monofunctional biosynthetic peptidoglycan transglycosylase [Myxococcales bacterium]